MLITVYVSTRILTSCPSTTLFSLALGPDLPHADEPAMGTLRFSVHRILTYVFATHADILTTISSTRPRDLASPYDSTLPYHLLFTSPQLRCIA